MSWVLCSATLRYALRKKLRDYLGIFPKWQRAYLINISFLAVCSSYLAETLDARDCHGKAGELENKCPRYLHIGGWASLLNSVLTVLKYWLGLKQLACVLQSGPWTFGPLNRLHCRYAAYAKGATESVHRLCDLSSVVIDSIQIRCSCSSQWRIHYLCQDKDDVVVECWWKAQIG